MCCKSSALKEDILADPMKYMLIFKIVTQTFRLVVALEKWWIPFSSDACNFMENNENGIDNKLI